MSTASDTAANASFTALTAGMDFTIPTVNLSGSQFQLPAASGALYAEIEKLTNAHLTTGVVGGSGTFDQLMAGVKAHLEVEFKANRITGAEYTKAYIALVQSAMGNAVQYLLGKDQAYWQAMAAQVASQTAGVQLVTARVQNETAKAQFRTAETEARTAGASFALTKAKLATEGIAYDTAAYSLSTMLPQQLNLLKEQTEAQRAQTLDTRFDGATVSGSVGKQKALYQQQIDSYKRDAEIKAAKIFTDAWITQKSMDEGTLPPSGFANASIDTILTALKANNGLT